MQENFAKVQENKGGRSQNASSGSNSDHQRFRFDVH